MTTFLAKCKLEAFKSWLDDMGFAHRLGKGEWQALQVFVEESGWQPLYFKKDAPNHLKVSDGLIGLVQRFLRRNHAS